MKRWKLIKILIDILCHDPFSYNPRWSWDILPKIVQDNYNKVRPVLLKWHEKGYITLVENDTVIFIVHPEKLPSKEELLLDNE